MSRLQNIAAQALVTATVLLGIGPAAAQTYPARYVRIITKDIGTFHDIVARHLAQQLSEHWGLGSNRRNQPANGLTMKTSIAAKALPDDTRSCLRTARRCARSLYKNLRYNPVKDFRPITLVARVQGIESPRERRINQSLSAKENFGTQLVSGPQWSGWCF
jgi:tripartite-type tricarboxylate transporter receptor subunit TctC